MRRLSRILLNAATAVSLALLVAVVVSGLAVSRTHQKPALWTWGDPVTRTRYEAGLRRGALVVNTSSGVRPATAPAVRELVAVYQRIWQGPGIDYRRHITVGKAPDWSYLPGHYGAFSYSYLSGGWLLLAAAPLPLWRATRFMWSRWAARRRRDAGLCMACGYDLRATPDRCPERGTIPRR
jgi:hypothetical protein